METSGDETARRARIAALPAATNNTATSYMHAGELETSVVLHAFRDVVRPGLEWADHDADDRRHTLSLGLKGYTTNGVIGWPSLATAVKVEAVLAELRGWAASTSRSCAPQGGGEAAAPDPACSGRLQVQRDFPVISP